MYISSDYFVNKCSKKKVVPAFRHGGNIQCDREIFPPTQITTFLYNNISENRHMKYNLLVFRYNVNYWQRIDTKRKLYRVKDNF